MIASDGSMYFGGVNGFNRFFPGDIKSNLDRLEVKLTELYITNKLIKPVEKRNSILDKSITEQKEIALDYSQNDFGINYSSVTLPSVQKKLEYAYILDGYETNWHHVNYKKRFANYTNIPPGDYTFKVKVKNRNGLWNEKDRELKITITPPWWKTNIAYLGYVILSILLFNIIITYRTRALTKRAELLSKQVKARTNEVEKLLQNKNEEFANVSHEFRTPLTLILGPITQVLKKLNPQSNQKEIKQLEVTQRNGYRLLRMVDQLLNIESFQVKSIVNKQPLAFGESTRLISEAFVAIAKENNIEFKVQNIADIYFEFTPDAYEKILLNLLSNAFKYTHQGGQVAIGSEITNSNELLITISDTGIGIPYDEQSAIFERFNRSTNVNKENVPGAGIGLSLVKNLVELHQGCIDLTSKPGVGTTIQVYLPITNPVSSSEVKRQADEELIAMELMSIASQTTAVSIEDDAGHLTQEDRNKILIIEDNDDMRRFIAESIQDRYHVLTASDGEQGVDIATKEIPDLIISDIMMPKLDGYQVTSLLRSQSTTDHIPIILLTAKDDRISRMKGWQQNADEYLTKPFDIDELNIRIKSLLDIRDLLKKRFANGLFSSDSDLQSIAKNTQEKAQDKFMSILNKQLEVCFAESDVTIPSIAAQIAMSERQLFRKLKNIADLTPTEYLRRFRLEKAKQMLVEGKSINMTSEETGFSSVSYFSRCFKAYAGTTPSDFVPRK